MEEKIIKEITFQDKDSSEGMSFPMGKVHWVPSAMAHKGTRRWHCLPERKTGHERRTRCHDRVGVKGGDTYA